MGNYSSMMRQKFGLAAYSGADDRGVETHAARTEYACRWEPMSKLLTGMDGQKILSAAVVYTEQPVTAKDRLYPPGLTALKDSRKPISIEVAYDLESGTVDHYRVTV